MAVGDEVMLAGPGHSGSSPNLVGRIVEISGRSAVCRVRWSDGRETMLASSVLRR